MSVDSIQDISTSSERFNRQPNYEGIDYFEEIDQRYITVDTKPRSIPGAQTVHFDPNSGMIYSLITKQDGLNRLGFAFNLRTSKYLDYREENKDPKTDDRLQKALSLIDPQYENWLYNPPGYPEVQSLIQSRREQSSIPFEALSSEIKNGDHILFYDSRSSLYACRPSSIEPITDMPSVPRGYRVFQRGTDPYITIYTDNYNPFLKSDNQKDVLVVGAILPKEHQMVYDKSNQGVWKLTPDEFRVLRNYAEIPFDPSIETPLSREEYVIAASLDGIAFDRWGASIEQIRTQNPTRYEGVTKANLQRAVVNLIGRFDEPAFANAIKWIAYQHMYRLHTPKHQTKVILAQNNAFGDIHSDIIGFTKDISELARQAIRNTHPVAIDMQKDGYGRVGEGVYNAKSVFGDVDLLEILKQDNPKIFNELIQYIASLPPINQGSWYGDSIVNPLAAIRDYFPDAYDLIKASLDSLPSDDIPGIEFSTE